MRSRGWLICALGMSAMGCGSDSHGGGIAELFEALNGDYQIREGTDCVIAIRGSRFESRMSTGETTCMETSFYEGEESDTEMLRASGTITDTRISGMLLNEESWPLHGADGCGALEGSGREATASAHKLTDRSAEGRFAGIAGTWEGVIEIAEYWFDTDCDGTRTRTNDRMGIHAFTADVHGDSIDVTYKEGGNPMAFEVLSSSSGDVIVDNEVVHFFESE